jgi:hypothetical protein
LFNQYLALEDDDPDYRATRIDSGIPPPSMATIPHFDDRGPSRGVTRPHPDPLTTWNPKRQRNDGSYQRHSDEYQRQHDSYGRSEQRRDPYQRPDHRDEQYYASDHRRDNPYHRPEQQYRPREDPYHQQERHSHASDRHDEPYHRSERQHRYPEDQYQRNERQSRPSDRYDEPHHRSEQQYRPHDEQQRRRHEDQHRRDEYYSQSHADSNTSQVGLASSKHPELSSQVLPPPSKPIEVDFKMNTDFLVCGEDDATVKLGTVDEIAKCLRIKYGDMNDVTDYDFVSDATLVHQVNEVKVRILGVVTYTLVLLVHFSHSIKQNLLRTG